MELGGGGGGGRGGAPPQTLILQKCVFSFEQIARNILQHVSPPLQGTETSFISSLSGPFILSSKGVCSRLQSTISHAARAMLSAWIASCEPLQRKVKSVPWTLAEFRHNGILQTAHENDFNVCRQHKGK